MVPATSERFRTEFRGSVPVVISDFAAALDWTAPALWADPTYLRQVVTDTVPTTPVSCNPSGATDFDPSNDVTTR